MHVYYIMIKTSQKFWVVYVCYRFIPEQCGVGWKKVPNKRVGWKICKSNRLEKVQVGWGKMLIE